MELEPSTDPRKCNVLYRCRACDRRYVAQIIDRDISRDMFIKSTKLINVHSISNFPLFDTHECPYGSFGIADLIGLDK